MKTSSQYTHFKIVGLMVLRNAVLNGISHILGSVSARTLAPNGDELEIPHRLGKETKHSL